MIGGYPILKSTSPKKLRFILKSAQKMGISDPRVSQKRKKTHVNKGNLFPAKKKYKYKKVTQK